MKMNTLLRLATLVALWGSFSPSYGYAQELAQHKPPKTSPEAPARVKLRDAVMQLGARYRVDILFEEQLLAGRVASPQSLASTSLEADLGQLLAQTGLRFKKVKNGAYMILADRSPVKVGESLPPVPTNTPQLGALTPALEPRPLLVAAKVEVTVRGKVTDENGAPLVGVNILEKGTLNGTITDVDGRYRLNVKGETSVLVFSFVGYLSQEVVVGNQTTVDVQLLPDTKALQEVVVVGYGTQVKAEVTGAVASVKAADLQGLATTTVDGLLQGKAAGVQVVQNTGQPGAEVFVRVRGTSSLRADSRPLYVIDGVPMNAIGGTSLDAGGQRGSALADINPADIESMEILKDASAAAIYGSRASNGVILITTKRGKDGRAKFNFDAFTGVQTVAKRYDLLNGQEFSTILGEAIGNRNRLNPNTVDLTRNGYPEALRVSGTNTDWQSEIFQAAPISNYNLSVSGGQNRLRSFVSLGLFNQAGTIIGQQFNRINGRLNLDYQATDRLKLTTSVTYSTSRNRRVTNDFSGASIIANGLLRNPNLPVRNPDGTYSVDPLGRNGTENPVMLANEISFTTDQKRLIANLSAEYEIVKGLTFKTIFGYDNLNERTQRYVPSFVLFRAGVAQAQAISSETGTWLNDNTLNFTKTFAEHHKISVLAGFGIQKSVTNFLYAGGIGTGSDIIRTIAVATADIPGNFISEWRLLSYFGRASYNFKDRYILEASFRTDGSSRFGANNRYGFFPAVSGAWRIIEEPFLKDSPLFSDLKLRAGVGITGNQEGLENFGSLTRYGTGANYDGLPGITQANVPNPNLSWESTTAYNVGVDASFFNARLNFNLDLYVRNTNNLLFTRQLPWTSGFASISNVNVGSMQNRGLDLTISSVNLNGGFKWTTDFNLSINRNEITDLPVNGAAGSDLIFKLPDAYSVEGPYTIYRVGQPVGAFYGYQYNGVFATNEEVPANLRDQPANQNYFGGYPRFLDLNNDGAFDRQNDRVIIGNALPKHTGGITNTFSYKGVELSVFMNWSYGNQVYNMTTAVLTSMADDFNQSRDVLGRWQQPGDVTNVPIPMYLANSFQGMAFTDASSRYIEDGSFLRIRNVNLGYNLPASLLSKIKVSSAKIYLSGQNLYTFTRYSGFDPESQNTGGGIIPSLGVDYLTQPIPRVFMVGLNLGF
jgi:TonB-dependent starch-binding outer membrane protein SusC